ncbi:Cdc6/Cdc18 family protein [Natrinema halophilum]|uniref:Cdc6/Cdc18 family protein n=1 Tax=Natrinema halophilum TaxID=1699371 RepID=UPI001F3167C3|nr:AAA family ATPase [Natrinema halophilum]UHQ96438.1 AAA family ATPase [Natrinema halophilum]
MIQDPRVFDDGFDDVELLHREGEMEEVLKRIVGSLTDSEILLSGPSGVGKSLFAQKALDELEARRSVDRIKIKCLGKTRAAIFRSLLEAHPNGPDTVAQTRATDSVQEEFEEIVDRKTVIVLDEGDDLPYTDAVGDLLAMPDVTVVAIVHDATDWLSKLEIDDGHAFDIGHIKLDHYVTDELADILERRARQGFFRPDIVSRTQLRDLADDVAGVARNGIQRLWGAANIADEREHLTIHDEDIQDGEDRAWRRIRRLNLESLPVHHRVLYAIVHEAGEISGEALHERYDEVADVIYQGEPAQPIGERARREKFQKLREYKLVDYEGPTRDRTYWVIDEDVEPQHIELPESVSTR